MKLFGHRTEGKTIPDPRTVMWAGVPVSGGAEFTHFLVTGTTGSGKTVTINAMLRSIIARVSAGEARAIVYDGKTEMVSALKDLGLPDNQLSILHPFDARGAAWDIARDVGSASEVQEIAELLFPTQRTSQPFFDHAATDLLRGAMLSFDAKHHGNWTFRDLLLALGSTDHLAEILGWYPGNSPRRRLYFARRRLLDDIMATLRTRVAPYEALAAHWWHAWHAGRRFSLSDWMSEGRGAKDTPVGRAVALLGNSHRSTHAVQAVNRVLFHRASQFLMDAQPAAPEHTWVVLDELTKAGKLGGLDLLVTKGRSKRVSVLLGFQDVAGLQHGDLYGPETTDEMLAQVAHKGVLRLQSAKTAKWAEQLFGHVEASEGQRQIGAAVSVTQQRVVRPAVLESEFLTIPPLDEAGLDGFYTRADSEDVVHVRIAKALVEQNPQGDPKLDFHPVPDPKEGHLENWSEDELKRLSLTRAPRRRRRRVATAGFPEGLVRQPLNRIPE